MGISLGNIDPVSKSVLSPFGISIQVIGRMGASNLYFYFYSASLSCRAKHLEPWGPGLLAVFDTNTTIFLGESHI